MSSEATHKGYKNNNNKRIDQKCTRYHIEGHRKVPFSLTVDVRSRDGAVAANGAAGVVDDADAVGVSVQQVAGVVTVGAGSQGLDVCRWVAHLAQT